MTELRLELSREALEAIVRGEELVLDLIDELVAEAGMSPATGHGEGDPQ